MVLEMIIFEELSNLLISNKLKDNLMIIECSCTTMRGANKENL